MAPIAEQNCRARDDADTSRTCIQAIELIYRLGLRPTPAIYEQFYSYADQSDLAIAPIIEPALSEGRLLSRAEVQKLQQQTSSEAGNGKRLQNLACQLSENTSDASFALKEAIGTATSYCNSLVSTKNGLAELRDPDKLATVVAHLVKTTQEMEKEGTSVQKRLNAISCDVELIKSDLESVRLQSFSDSLTNTANRRYFDRAFAAAVADAETSGQPLCLCMVDADHFKSFNDKHGHQAGDSALRVISSVLKHAVRDRDIVARYGGEEFAILLNGADLETGVMVAERIRSNLVQKDLISRSTRKSLGNITVSIGVAQYNKGETVTSFMERADACLYKAKEKGRNKVICERELSAESEDRSLTAAG